MLGGPVRTITEQDFRPFKTDKWDGMSIHKRTGKTEMGVQAHLFLQNAREEANKIGCGEVLNAKKKKIMSATLDAKFEERVKEIEDKMGAEDVSTNAMIRLESQYEKLQKILNTGREIREARNAQAQKVLDIIKSTAGPSILLRIAPLELSHQSATETIVDAIMEDIEDNFMGSAEDVRNQLNAHVAAIGVARTKLQVQMLMAQIQYWAKVASLCLLKANPDNTPEARRIAELLRNEGEPVDYPPTHIQVHPAVPTFTQTELLNLTLQRLDDQAHARGRRAPVPLLGRPQVQQGAGDGHAVRVRARTLPGDGRAVSAGQDLGYRVGGSAGGRPPGRRRDHGAAPGPGSAVPPDAAVPQRWQQLLRGRRPAFNRPRQRQRQPLRFWGRPAAARLGPPGAGGSRPHPAQST